MCASKRCISCSKESRWVLFPSPRQFLQGAFDTIKKSQDHIINKKAMKCDDDVAEHESKELLPRVATGLFLTPQNSLPQAVELKTEQTSAAGRSPEANWCRYCSTLSTAFLAFAVRDSKLQMHGWNLVGVLLSVISIRAILRSVASLHCHDPLPDPERVQ